MDLPEFMKQLALDAGALTLQYLENGCTDTESKATEKDVVTIADKATEAFIVNRLREAYPDYDVYGEESGRSGSGGSPYLWVIDPIDGTTNFAAGLPEFCISIGLLKDGVPVAGVIYAPLLNQLYEAQTGCGATLNGKPIRVSGKNRLVESIGVTGFGCLRANLQKNNLPVFSRIAPLLRGVRRSGSAALDLCTVAAGNVEFFWEYPLGLYDVAAGMLIVREAGGVVTDFDNGNRVPERGVLASNGLLHETVRAMILEDDYRP